MKCIKGKGVYAGIAIGTARLYAPAARERNASAGGEGSQAYISPDGPPAGASCQALPAPQEIDRFRQAVQTARAQLAGLYEKALKEAGEESAMIFEVHQMMLEDLDYNEAIEQMIAEQGVTAETAVACTGDSFSRRFAAMKNAYMKERAADVRDISSRVVNILSGTQTSGIQLEEPVILLADDLTPSETIQLDKSKILAFVTRYGSANSHTAILARTMNIPALVSVDFPQDADGKTVVADGENGLLYIEPEAHVLEEYQSRRQRLTEEEERLACLKNQESVTLDGVKVEVCGNVGNAEDIRLVQDACGDGIGLFRSEFLYLEADDFPSEETQFQAYQAAVQQMEGKRVVIRTLDIGADKRLPYLDLGQEENPAMGCRAIRICLTRTEIFKTQLRALCRASYYGRLAIMFPMITSVEEVREARQILNEVLEELKAEQIPVGQMEIGVMIETPAAVMISDLLAKEVDFFSIGTNDLTQYTLAADRQNPNLDRFYRPRHEALLRMIRMTVENGHRGGCWVGICGELAADDELTETFLQMGVDELSVAPPAILKIREKVRSSRALPQN